MNKQAAYEARVLNDYLSSHDDDIIIIEPNDNDCSTRKRTGIRRHIMVNGECRICGGITEKELQHRRDQADQASWYAEPDDWN